MGCRVRWCRSIVGTCTGMVGGGRGVGVCVCHYVVVVQWFHNGGCGRVGVMVYLIVVKGLKEWGWWWGLGTI